jgi:uncharacterized protein YacL
MVSVILQIATLVVILVAFWMIWRRIGGQAALPKVGHADDRRKVFVDTSTIMDGRILSVAKTGFLGDHFMIPKSVLQEMQTLADGPDTNKRTRARFGMDVAKELQEIDGMKVEIFDDSELRGGVDGRLVKLAQNNNAIILTNDFNLGKMAAAQGIKILNVNDLTQSLRSEMLPGEKTTIELIQKGSVSGQAVGYLSDGTMVVVNNAVDKIGKRVEVEMDRYLQTAAGKMLFAKLIEVVGSENKNTKKNEKNDTPKRQNGGRRSRAFHSEDM